MYHKFLKLGVLAVAITASLALLAGCGGSQSSSSAGSQPEQKLTVGYSAAGGSGVLTFVANEEGYFKDAGLSIELVPFTSTADGLHALTSGKIDVGIGFGTGGPLTLANKGEDVVIIGGSLAGGHPMIATPEKAAQFNHFKSIEDYRGRSVATPRLYTPDIVFRGALAKAGINSKTDLDLIEMKNPSAVLEAVKSGKVDAGVGTTAVYIPAKKAGLEIVGWSNDFYPNHPCCRVVTTSKEIKEKPAALQAFLEGIIRAEKVKKDNPDRAVEINNKYLKLSDDEIRDVTLEPHQVHSSDPNKKGVIQMYDDMVSFGYLEKNIDPADYINIDLYKKALDKVIADNPQDEFFKSLQKRYEEQNL